MGELPRTYLASAAATTCARCRVTATVPNAARASSYRCNAIDSSIAIPRGSSLGALVIGVLAGFAYARQLAHRVADPAVEGHATLAFLSTAAYMAIGTSAAVFFAGAATLEDAIGGYFLFLAVAIAGGLVVVIINVLLAVRLRRALRRVARAARAARDVQVGEQQRPPAAPTRTPVDGSDR